MASHPSCLAPERSLYAIELAHRLPSIAGLILESGIADPGKRFLTYADLAAARVEEKVVLAEVERYFNHQQKLSGYHGPLLVLHTENDGLIDISHAELISTQPVSIPVGFRRTRR